MMRSTFVLGAVLAVAMVVPAAAEMRLGVLAPRGADKANERWSAMADYLGAQLGDRVTLVPMGPEAGTEAFLERSIDFLLGNPVQTAVVVDTMGGIPVASLAKPAGDQFAGVIVAGPGTGIATAADLRGKRVAALRSWAAGGFIFQAQHVAEAGLDVPGDFAEHYVGTAQDELVMRVIEGTSDAAFVRTGLLEAMIAEGRITPDQIVIVDAQPAAEGFAQMRSTQLYPEWFAVAQDWTDPAVIDALRGALLGLTADHPAAQAARIAGFVAPKDVSGVVSAMQNLRIPPYE